MNKLLFVLTLLITLPALAADLPPPSAEYAKTTALREAIKERALLYQLRAAFDVGAVAAIPQRLAADAKVISSAQYQPDQDDEVRDDLLAEGSYYVVSLKYLVEVGGANWPLDRSASLYEVDALNRLSALQRRWILAAETNPEDLQPVLMDLDTINAWTEGATRAEGLLAHFLDTDTLVDAALSSLTSSAVDRAK